MRRIPTECGSAWLLCNAQICYSNQFVVAMMDTKLEFVLLSSITMVESVATTCKRHEKY